MSDALDPRHIDEFFRRRPKEGVTFMDVGKVIDLVERINAHTQQVKAASDEFEAITYERQQAGNAAVAPFNERMHAAQAKVYSLLDEGQELNAQMTKALGIIVPSVNVDEDVSAGVLLDANPSERL